MTGQAWSIAIGVASAVMLALLPWMFTVHAKLAVLMAAIAELGEKLDKLMDADRKRLTHCIQHGARLDDHERRIDKLEGED